ncbi:MAG: biotin--[acetyl-CoA-carboxylase] ligase [Acidobacteria bacterium]|nr:biotin--[acetyl-CoA-carboxylase] ligase [Acidobacteriota bacterium]MBI3422126.1 biotin--[acetyl-CoA-carboxylase] ligase [Acidobacteriota bacterium]
MEEKRKAEDQPFRIPHSEFRILTFATLGSTNDYLKQLVGAPEFTCVIADEQTAGRGRRARAWVSTPGEGLYLSVLLRPSAPANIALLSLLAAVAVAETLAQYNVAGLDIKWPNDVLIGERKVCGILVEGASSGAQALRVIAGIGVNLNHQQFPPEIGATATSLALQLGHAVDAAEFRERLLARLAHWYTRWQHDAGRSVLERWQQLSSYAQGQTVAVTLDDEQVFGTTAGLTKDGALRLQLADGTTRTLLVGEVAKLRKSRLCTKSP